MSKKRVQLLRNYVYGTNRDDKINNARLLVQEYGFFPTITNQGLHFHWKEMYVEFNFWPSTEKMNIFDSSLEEDKQRKTIIGAASIAKALEKYETLLFKEVE